MVNNIREQKNWECWEKYRKMSKKPWKEEQTTEWNRENGQQKGPIKTQSTIRRHIEK